MQLSSFILCSLFLCSTLRYKHPVEPVAPCPEVAVIVVQPEIKRVKKEAKRVKKAVSGKDWSKLGDPARQEIVDAYIKRFFKAAKAEEARFGIPAALILGRGARESRFFTSPLAVETNNLYGIKYTKKLAAYHPIFDKGAVNYHDDDPNDLFIKFESPWMSMRAFCYFIQRPNYMKYLKQPLSRNSLEDFAQALCKGGYSTSCNWMNDVTTGKQLMNRAKQLGLK